MIALKSKDFFVLLGLEQIPSNEVVILPSLLNYGCKDNLISGYIFTDIFQSKGNDLLL